MEKGKSKMVITSLAWIKRGYAKAVTDLFEDMQDPKQLKEEMDIEEQQIDKSDRYNLKNYDNEVAVPTFVADYKDMVNTNKISKPKKDEEKEEEDEEIEGEGDIEYDEEKFPFMVDDDEEEKEDFVIRKSDALIIVAAAEQNYSNIEVYLYEEENSNLFVHHEIMLNAYPLWLQWIPYVPGSNASFSQKGNYVAVGTFSTAIEIWNLDMIDWVEPVIILGGEKEAGKNMPLASMKRKNKMKYYSDGSHTDAVLCIAVHPTEVNKLASGSADKIIKIWDLSTQKWVRDIKMHKDRVQVLQWNPKDTKMLLSAGFDGKGVVWNTKNTNEHIKMVFGNTEIESGCWHPIEDNAWFFSFENGWVKGYDIRKHETPVIDFQAHNQQWTGVACTPANEALLATSSVDGYINIWDLKSVEDSKPKLIQAKNMKVGGLFTWKFYEDSPWILASGGMKGELGIWDLEESEYVVKHFQGQEAYEKLKKTEKDLGLEGRASPEPQNDDDGSSENEDYMNDQMMVEEDQ